jgi:hypothetical protein
MTRAISPAILPESRTEIKREQQYVISQNPFYDLLRGSPAVQTGGKGESLRPPAPKSVEPEEPMPPAFDIS